MRKATTLIGSGMRNIDQLLFSIFVPYFLIKLSFLTWTKHTLLTESCFLRLRSGACLAAGVAILPEASIMKTASVVRMLVMDQRENFSNTRLDA